MRPDAVAASPCCEETVGRIPRREQCVNLFNASSAGAALTPALDKKEEKERSLLAFA
jgi:hypothetical protein